MKKFPITYKLYKKRTEKLSKFEIFQIILAIYNSWSFLIMFSLQYGSFLFEKFGGDEELIRADLSYKVTSVLTGWYINGFTVLLTYFICSIIAVFSFYTYFLQMFKKAKWHFARPSKRYLLLMGFAALSNCIMFMINFI